MQKHFAMSKKLNTSSLSNIILQTCVINVMTAAKSRFDMCLPIVRSQFLCIQASSDLTSKDTTCLHTHSVSVALEGLESLREREPVRPLWRHTVQRFSDVCTSAAPTVQCAGQRRAEESESEDTWKRVWNTTWNISGFAERHLLAKYYNHVLFIATRRKPNSNLTTFPAQICTRSTVFFAVCAQSRCWLR